MKETTPPQTISIRLVDIDKKFIEPYTIQDNFVTLVAFHYAEREIIIDGKTVRNKPERLPIMLIWDGSEIRYMGVVPNTEFVIGEQKYILDRSIDEYPTMPSSQLILELSTKGQKIIEEFDPKELFNMVYDYFDYYFYLTTPMMRKMVSLFAINQVVFDAFNSTPYLYVSAPANSCGKSHLGQSVVEMSNGLITTNLREHHIFRMVHSAKMSIAIDEIKGWTGKSANDRDIQDALSMINTGFQKGGSRIPRMVEKVVDGQKRWVIEFFETYSPKIFITTQLSLPEDTMSRCINVGMQRAGSAENDINYAERWDEPERLDKLSKIRDMAYKYRLKCGMKLKALGSDKDWRQKIDIKGTFSMVKNRERQIFGPLIISCLVYKPEWQDDLAAFIKQSIENRTRVETSLVSAILYAIRDIWQQYEATPDFDGKVIFKNNIEHGRTIYIPIDNIVNQIKLNNDMVYLGKNENSTVGKTLKELGFTRSDRQNYGMRRIISGDELNDRCLRYIGRGIGSAKSGGGLSQVEKVAAIREALTGKDIPKDGLNINELLLKLNGKVAEKELRQYLEQLRQDGNVAVTGKGDIRWFD